MKVLDGLPGFLDKLKKMNRRFDAGPGMLADGIKRICRSGDSIFRVFEQDTNSCTETLTLGYTMKSPERRRTHGWGAVLRPGWKRVYAATFATPAHGFMGYVASTDLAWLLERLAEVETRGAKVTAKSWED